MKQVLLTRHLINSAVSPLFHLVVTVQDCMAKSCSTTYQSLATSTNISHQNDPIIGPMMVVLPKLVFPLLGGCFWDGPCLSPHSSLWANSPIFKCLSSVKHGMQASIAAGSVAAQRLQKLCTISGVGNAAAPLLCKCCASTLSGNVAVQRLQKL